MPLEWWALFVFFAVVVWACLLLAVWIIVAEIVRFFARRSAKRAAAGQLLDMADRYRVGL